MFNPGLKKKFRGNTVVLINKIKECIVLTIVSSLFKQNL